MSDGASTQSPPGEPAIDAGGGANAASYRVLARKYRPATFEDLIGQDAMVRTLANAFDAGRLPQAWILTGVRGVGKTTTARILARALNYDAPDVGGPTIHMPALGTHCQAIMEGRHVDVIEMDAASHNGVDDIRQINDAVRYAPVSARYKVYILDEVHMLSTAAFNALLKTLEEPPPHVKFVFATTEIRKVPVTVLSRCQRFDLRRVEAGVLVAHLQRICKAENITVEDEALAMIARAAEGSVRDALSLLDQAIAHAAGAVKAADIRQMLGLADRARIIDLFDALMRGDMARALGELRDQYDAGADPAIALTDLADFTHFVTRIKVVPSIAEDPSYAEAERGRGREFAAALSMRVLSRTWQMLLKGIAEAQSAAKPLAAAEMVLVRIAYAAGLPSPEDLVGTFSGGDAPGADAVGAAGRPNGNAPRATMAAAPATASLSAGGPREFPRSAPRAQTQQAARAELAPSTDIQSSEPVRAVARFEDLIALAQEKRDLMVKAALERDVRLVGFEDGKLEVALEPGASKALVGDLARKLQQWTNRRWMVVISAEAGAPTVRAQADARREEISTGVTADPLVQAVLTSFPGAEIVGVRLREDLVPPPAVSDTFDEANPPPVEDDDIDD
ncbi:MAG: DNA polymerase III subunit gamma/tau [Variibacter sp.]